MVIWEITTTFIAVNAIPIFSNKQFGFIKGRSTSLQLLQILDKWTELLKNGGQIDVIYTDLEKAFDKIPHKMLISKLSSYGLNKEIISWVPVGCGIPQSSLLGPILLLFILMILLNMLTMDQISIYMWMTQSYFLLLKPWKIQPRFRKIKGVFIATQLNWTQLDAGMWRYHANRMDARRSQFDLGRVDAYI